MKIIVYCENDPGSAPALTAKACTMTPDVTALAESKEGCHACLAAGAADAVCMMLDPDDCAQGDRIANALRQLQPDAVLFPATIRGRFLSAWVAAKLETGLTADCTALSLTEDGLLLQSRPAFGGNLQADIVCKTARPQMASVRPGVFPPTQLRNLPEELIRVITTAAQSSYLQPGEMIAAESEQNLQTARIIVAGGKGVGSKAGFAKLRRLADLLGASLGATRAAVDAGYVDYACQIGQTGVTVRPELYINFGVAGIVQHMVGMNAAKTVISVNTDRHALIFTQSDYGIVSDWETVADELINILEHP